MKIPSLFLLATALCAAIFCPSFLAAQCTAPSALSATSQTTNGATLNWTENGTATLWDIEIQPDGTPATGTPTESGVTKPYVWTGGSQATNYQFWVRSDCGGGSYSTWAGPFGFLTAMNNAAAICVTLPIPDGGCFGGNNSLDLPISVSGVPGSSLGTDVFIDRVELIVGHFFLADLEIQLTSPAGASLTMINYSLGGQNLGNPGTCPSQSTVFAPWATTPITAVFPPYNYIGNFLPAGSFSVFDGNAPNGNWTLSICDIFPPYEGYLRYIRIYFTQCRRPSALSASNLTPSGATFNWTENGTATAWDLEFQPVGTSATGTPTVSGVTKPYTWTGGNQHTNYQAWVRSNCGGSTSEWVGPLTFQTAIDNAAPACLNTGIPDNTCTWYPITVSGAPGSTLGTDVFLDKVEVILHHTWVDELDIYLETPSGTQIQLSTDNGGTGDNYGGTCSSQTTTFAMGASTPITAGSAPFIGTYMPEGNFATFNGANPNGNWNIAICDDGPFATGTLKYVRLHFTACPTPSAFSVNNLTPSGANFDWTESAGATLWDIEIQPAGTPATGTPTLSGVTKPYTWTGGTQATNYQVWVRSHCSSGGFSSWVGAYTFQTPIDNAAPACVNFALPAANACAWFPVYVTGAPGNTLGTDVFLDKVEVIAHHAQANELDIYLETPSNIQIELSTDNGGSGDNYGNTCPSEFTTFAMWAPTPVTAGSAPFIGTYIPEGNFTSFNGADPNGNWELAICDDGNTAVGSLKYVRLYFSNVLPVTLASFTATPTKSGQVQLDWATESEQNSEWFAAERSANGTDFSEIARIRAAGNSTEEQRYTYLDGEPLPGTNYYRLRQIDLDGTFGFSPVRTATINTVGPHGWKVYPNPARGSFYVETNGEAGHLSLIASNGQVVWSAAVPDENNIQAVPTTGIPAGLYWLQLRTASGFFAAKMVVE